MVPYCHQLISTPAPHRDHPKKHQVGKWRLIVDLSSPKGSSVNGGIDPSLCSMSYVSVQNATEKISKLGRGALLAKLDIKDAYRIGVPIAPEKVEGPSTRLTFLGIELDTLSWEA